MREVSLRLELNRSFSKKIVRGSIDHLIESILKARILLPNCHIHYQIALWAITDMAVNFFILLMFQ